MNLVTSKIQQSHSKEYLSMINWTFLSVLDIECGPSDTVLNKILTHLRESDIEGNLDDSW